MYIDIYRHVYIYIYVYRERERDGSSWPLRALVYVLWVCVYFLFAMGLCVYIQRMLNSSFEDYIALYIADNSPNYIPNIIVYLLWAYVLLLLLYCSWPPRAASGRRRCPIMIIRKIIVIIIMIIT